MTLAHGIGQVTDLPLPAAFFYTTAAVVVVVSFLLLGLLWRRPLLERHADGRPLPPTFARIVLSPALRIVLGAVSVGLLALTLAATLFGSTVPLLNFAPTFIYVVFWVGVPILSVLLGNVWSMLSPWRAIADAAVWAYERTGRVATPVLDYPYRWGRYPAALALLAFVTLELAHPGSDAPRTLAVAVSLYTYWALAGMAVFGRETWTRSGEGFAVAFGLFARIAPFANRHGSVVVRWPLTGLAGADPVPGTLAVVAVLLGSTSFDGFGATSEWQNVESDVRARFVDESPRVVDVALTLVNVAGLAYFVGLVLVTYLLAIFFVQRLVGSSRSLVPDFVLPLVPIAFAYVLAHYFSLIAINGQFIVALISDPLGRGWDLFGTADFAPNLTIVSQQTIFYVKVVALTLGHVAGLAIAHDRAVALFPDRRTALRSQYPMLGLMVLYTLGGLWVLSQS